MWSAICIVALLLIALIVGVLMYNAPAGHEDAGGFHLDKK
jgi:hypothetical protein